MLTKMEHDVRFEISPGPLKWHRGFIPVNSSPGKTFPDTLESPLNFPDYFSLIGGSHSVILSLPSTTSHFTEEVPPRKIFFCYPKH